MNEIIIHFIEKVGALAKAYVMGKPWVDFAFAVLCFASIIICGTIGIIEASGVHSLLMLLVAGIVSNRFGNYK